MAANVFRPEDAQVLPPRSARELTAADPVQLATFSSAAKVDLRDL